MNRGTARYPLLEIDLDKLKANLAALIERCQSLSVEVAGVEVLGASSDHTILDVEDAAVPVRLGDVLDFGVSYGSLVYLTNTPEVRIVYRKNGRLYTAE